MADRVGTSSSNLASSTGGLTDELGNQLIGTDTSGGQAQTLGPGLSREVSAGLPNADFSLLPPEGLDTAISDANELPFYSLSREGAASVNTIRAEIVSSPITDSGRYELKFTAPANTEDDSELFLERWIPIPGDYAGSFMAYPIWHVYTPSYTDAAVYFLNEVAYYAADMTLLGDDRNSWQLGEFSGINNNGIYGRLISLGGFEPGEYGFTGIPSEAKWLRIRFGMAAYAPYGQTTLTTTEEFYVTGIRLGRGVAGPIGILDTNPADYGTSYANLTYDSSNLAISAERGYRATGGYAPQVASLELRAGLSSPSDSAFLTHTNLAPHGATYVGPTTNLGTGTNTKLGLNAGPVRGAGLPAADTSTDRVYPGRGTYLVLARVGYDSAGTGYRRMFIYKNASAIASSSYGTNGSISYTAHALTVTTLTDTDYISVYGQQNSGGTIGANVEELTLIRLGDTW